MSAAPLLEAKGLTKRFHGLLAIDNVSFELKQGEMLGLIGPNGAGKTTLISLISGTLHDDGGTLLFEGKPIDRLPPYERAHLGIGRTFQVMKPFPRLTVLENVAVGALFGLNGGVRDLKEAREQARALLDFTGLAHRADQQGDQLGGPDRKRLELAKALALRPKLLLLDEVMAGLNPSEIDEVVAIVKKIRDRGMTILVIEHVMRAIRSLSDRIMVLHHGEMLAQGEPNAILADPRVVDAYLGKRRA
ncbi:MAG TPA: ABC transporter ATP-binding protein [Stellaceae bacterium]|jgi:branched-chain amino acid transport system ATP-binding protein|nr:ABC transporter ATP-binding protein [Stellaceae bacterium]